jgi:hypothetical protein
MRSALVDYFRDEGEMIATEAGAEGINLQFCALVVNYDLPWNSQQIEQCIVLGDAQTMSRQARLFILGSRETRSSAGRFSAPILGGGDSQPGA